MGDGVAEQCDAAYAGSKPQSWAAFSEDECPPGHGKYLRVPKQNTGVFLPLPT